MIAIRMVCSQRGLECSEGQYVLVLRGQHNRLLYDLKRDMVHLFEYVKRVWYLNVLSTEPSYISFHVQILYCVHINHTKRPRQIFS